MDEICKAFTIKHWWKLRNTNCLWSQFLGAKYCGTTNPINTTWRPDISHHWMAMSELRLKVEDNIGGKLAKERSVFGLTIGQVLSLYTWFGRTSMLNKTLKLMRC